MEQKVFILKQTLKQMKKHFSFRQNYLLKVTKKANIHFVLLQERRKNI